jgi:hypothetical protein
VVISRSLLLFLTSLLLLLTQQVTASPIASVNRSVIAIDDTLTLTLRINKTSFFTQPDLSDLDKDFHVLSNSQSSKHVMHNGKSESSTDWVITLAPKRKGQLTIPSIDIDGEKTQAITINVQPSVPRSSGSTEAIFLESEVNIDSIYPQQQLIFTLRILHAIQLDNMNISEPDIEDATVKKLSQNSYQRRIKNTPYRVHELHYAIFPQQAGELIIPSQTFTANEAQSRRSVFMQPNQGKKIRKISQPHRIKVKKTPANFIGKTWLPAEAITLTETWSTDPDTIRVGDSITRTITITANGLIDAQLPPFELAAIEGAKFYPDQANADTKVSEEGVTAFRADSIAIIPTREGHIELDEIKFQWWNTTNNTLQEAIISKRTLLVKAALHPDQKSTPFAVDHSKPLASMNTSTAPINQEDNTLFWQITTSLFTVAWIITLAFYWQLKRTLSAPEIKTVNSDSYSPTEKQAFKQLSLACKNNHQVAIRAAIIEWGQCFWSQQKIHNLKDIEQLSQQPALKPLFLQLDNQLYGNSPDSSEWNGESLLVLIKKIRKAGNKNHYEKANDLAPLYQ